MRGKDSSTKGPEGWKIQEEEITLAKKLGKDPSAMYTSANGHR